MNRTILHKGRILTFLCVGLLASGAVFADKPNVSGGDKKDKHGKNDGGKAGKSSNNGGKYGDTGHDEGRQDSYSKHSDKNNSDNRDHDDYGQSSDRNDAGNRNHNERDKSYSTQYFDKHRRNEIYDYYAQRIRKGHCPPGLRKKKNRCQPPGHAKKWQIGHRLPRDVIFYNLEPQIQIYLGPPPPMHRYVRVASDILLIAVGTGMVLDAIDDLGRY